jgi:excisionase family DNA binding protein
MAPPEAPPIPSCGRQLRLPRYPAEPHHVSDAVSVVVRDGVVWWFHQGMPIGSHAVSDVAGFRHQSSVLCDGGACALVEIERAFGVSAISVKRALKQYRKGGARSFYEHKRTAREGPVMTPDRLREVQGLIDQGLSDRQIAEHLGLKRDTIYRTVRAGRLRRPEKGGSRRSPMATALI